MCVHMTALNCLVRNANTYVVHGNSLSLEAYGGYFVRRSPFGGELFRLSKDQADELMRLPFTAGAETALTPATAGPVVHEAAPKVRETLDEVEATFEILGFDSKMNGLRSYTYPHITSLY